MDLQLFGGVLWRHKVIVSIGFLLAILLAVLSMVRSTDAGLTYRQQEKWQTSSKILVTQTGFPEGRIAVGGDDADRFVKLAYLYASFIDADSVRARFEQRPKIKGEKVVANAIVVQGSGASLPIIDVTGVAATEVRSKALTRRATDALLQYIARKQESARIADKNRVIVQLIQSPAEAKLVQGRPLTLPILAFLASMSLVLGFVFVLENLKRSRRLAEEAAIEEPPAPVQAVTDDRTSSRRWKVEDDDVEVPRPRPLTQRRS
jgi:hypothetical protein